MTLLLTLALIWFAVACVISPVVGAAIRLADRRETQVQPEPVAEKVAA